MYLRKKIFVFAIVPLLLALFAIALTIYFQATSLARLQRATIEPVYRANKEAELRNYVALAEQSIASFYEDEMDGNGKEKAKDLLRKLKFGEDGYFFVNDFDGKILVQPNQPYREGKIQLDRRDSTGTLIIQKLINVAHNGGGFVEYTMEKPSVKKVAPKLAYVIALPKWEWVLGTGIYLDDVDVALEEIDRQVSDNIAETMLWIISISFLGLIAIFFGLLLNIKERTVLDDKLSEANSKLASLSQRLIDAREKERERIRFDLHDGVQPMLAATRMKIETGLATLPGTAELAKNYAPFRSANRLLGDTFTALRKIIDGIAVIDPHLPLADQLSALTLDMSTVTMPIEFTVMGRVKEDLPMEVKETLFKIAQAALDNIINHAGADHAWLRLEGDENSVKLEVCDNGGGFDVDLFYNQPRRGIGLSSMKARLESVGGKFAITSSSAGTCMTGIIPS